MDTKPNPNRNAIIITIALMVAGIPTSLIFAYLGYTTGSPQLYVVVAITIAGVLLDFIPLGMIRKGQRIDLAMTIVISVFLVIVFPIIFLVKGIGSVIALLILMIVAAAVGLGMASRYTFAGNIAAFALAATAIGLDISLSSARLELPFLQSYSIYVLSAFVIVVVYLFLREFRKFSLQTKITLGILLTGGITLAVLLYFSVNRADLIIRAITTRYENNIARQTQAQILSGIQEEANLANQLFTEVESDAQLIASYLSQLASKETGIQDAAYWDAAEKVFQLSGGQYGNSPTEPASFYLPNTYELDELMIEDINSNILLDFVADGFMKTHPDVSALYFISQRGYTLYYPNIALAENVPPDFDPTLEPFFTIASPRNNQNREARWTPPYQDPAGNGLIVTLSLPIYSQSGAFKGVVGIDIKLALIAESISAIQFGRSGFSMLLDQNGLILAMPEEGYRLFGLEPEIIPVNESPKQTIFGRGPDAIQVITSDILSGETDLKTIRSDGTETYVAYTALPATGYRLAAFAPVEELNVEIIASRNEIQNEINTTIQGAIFILIAMLLVAILSSVWISQVITRPLKQLTSTVQKIADGDLSARVEVTSTDETGILANSFNIMTDTLNNTLTGLEDRIRERTIEVERVSESNAYRASQLESIARISRTISSTQSLGNLLPQIAITISDQLGFYHTGIFLLDSHKEYAILVAANSEGGQRMLARNHRLQVGGAGIVGYATNTGEARVALDVGQDAVYFNNPDLPETHSEIALPLKIGDEIIGALDVQSTEINAFSQEDVNILSTLADQVAIAIQNSRSYQQSIEALQQAEQIASQLSEQQWKSFLAQQGSKRYVYDGVDAKEVSAIAVKDASVISIPLILRGNRIGTLKLSSTMPNHNWDNDDIAMAQAAADRTAFAIENARLIIEAQKRAAKERVIGEISSKIGSLVNIENILQTAIQELGTTLPGTNIAFQFTSTSDDRDSGE